MKKLMFLLVFCVLSISSAWAQKTFSGKVIGPDGLGLPGVSVVEKANPVNGFATDIDGNWTLTVPNGNSILQFTAIGMKPIEIAAKDSKELKMQNDAQVLDEVMVVAYGTAKKSTFTGSASTVKSDDLQKISADNVSKALEGLSSGVQVTSGSGQPGTTSSIRIRGIGSINASASPLIVVDGFPYGGSLNSISNNDIETLTVLKDASATALYGSRAANGVIIITTKKGKKGKSELEFKANFGFVDRALPEYDRVSVGEYYKLTWENLKNQYGGDGQKASDNLVKELGGYNAYKGVADNEIVNADGTLTSSRDYKWKDDWQDELFKIGFRQDYTLSASFGTEKTKAYVSANYLDAEGIIKASKFKRYAGRINVESDIKEWIKITASLSGSTSEQNYPNSSGSSYVNSFMYTRMVAPIYPVYLYDKEGTLQLDAKGNKKFDYGNEFGRDRKYSSDSNPLGVIGLDTRLYKNDIVSARGKVDFKIIEGLHLAIGTSADYWGYNGITHQNAAYGDAKSFKGRSTRESTRSIEFATNQILTYKKDFNEHHLDFLVGHESMSYIYNNLEAKRTGFPGLGFVELGAAAVPEGSNSYENKFRLESYLSRFNYDYADRYYASLSFRTDGSSRFHPDQRWGNFWSIGLGWRISEESFMENIDWITDMKLKASYGAQGNDRLGTYYAYLSTFDPAYANLKAPGLLFSRLATPDLTWEKNNSWNFGLEAKLVDRINVNFEYFIRESDDLLFTLPLAPSTGVSGVSANIGAIKNSGFELELSAQIFDTNDFKWKSSLNLTHYKNEITELPQDHIITGSKRWEVGRSVYDFWIQKYAGVDEKTGKALWYKNEKDADGNVTGQTTTDKYSSADRYYVGSAIPDIMGGFTNEFAFKGFDLSVLVSYAFGGKTYDSSYAALMDGGANFGNHWHKDILNHWTAENKNTDVPIIHGGLSKDANSRSDRFLTDASYVNIKNINLGYSLPERLTEKVGINSIRVFTSVDNLWLFSKRKGMDPQQSLSGVLDNVYTPLRTVSFGVNVKF